MSEKKSISNSDIYSITNPLMDFLNHFVLRAKLEKMLIEYRLKNQICSMAKLTGRKESDERLEGLQFDLLRAFDFTIFDLGEDEAFISEEQISAFFYDAESQLIDLLEVYEK